MDWVIYIIVFASSVAISVTPATGMIYYVRTSKNITIYPHDIPLDAEKIIINSTGIDHVDYIEAFPNLTSYQIKDNMISTFPDLSNVSATLVELVVSGTLIESIALNAVATMPALKQLDIGFNRLTQLPDLTAVFPALGTLNVNCNKLVSMGQTSATTLCMDGNKMTALPDLSNVLDTFLSLNISNNNITSLQEGAIPLMPRCYYLNLNNNKLSTFPDLTNLTGLISLDLSSNQIRTIPNLPPLSLLATFKLNRNNLTAFPNLVSIADSLLRLYIDENDIVDFPDELLVPLSRLRSLSMGRRDGGAIYLPNFCLIRPTNPPLSLTFAEGSMIHCDLNALYAKLAQQTGSIQISSTVLCASPAHLVGRNFDDLTTDDLWPKQTGRYHPPCYSNVLSMELRIGIKIVSSDFMLSQCVS